MNTNTGEVKPIEHLTNEEKRNGKWKEIDSSRLTPMQQKQLARTGRTTVSRNSPCPCGSGKRFKRCCMTNEATDAL